jgi:hypothetical protein
MAKESTMLGKKELASPTSSAVKKANDKTIAMVNLVEVDELVRVMFWNSQSESR